MPPPHRARPASIEATEDNDAVVGKNRNKGLFRTEPVADRPQQKHTLQSHGIWEKLRRVLAISPERSNGVPLNPWFRYPAPGALEDVGKFEDVVTLPAGDIAGNPYWKRDHRRSHPQLSVLKQADVASLLAVGSAAAPKVELIGEAGEKQLVAAKEQGETEGLAKFLESAPKDVAKDVFVNGLPPLPSGQKLKTDKWDVYDYDLVEEQSYPDG